MEYRVLVAGVARSKYAKSATRYERSVNSADRRQFAKPLRSRDLAVEVHHFYTSGHPVDLDTLLKSILDGLKSAVYEDDSQVSLSSQYVTPKCSVDLSWRVI